MGCSVIMCQRLFVVHYSFPPFLVLSHFYSLHLPRLISSTVTASDRAMLFLLTAVCPNTDCAHSCWLKTDTFFQGPSRPRHLCFLYWLPIRSPRLSRCHSGFCVSTAKSQIGGGCVWIWVEILWFHTVACLANERDRERKNCYALLTQEHVEAPLGLTVHPLRAYTHANKRLSM